MKFLRLSFLILIFITVPLVAMAQEDDLTAADTAPVSAAPAPFVPGMQAPSQPQPAGKIVDVAMHKARISPPGVTPDDLGSLMFTPWQQALLEEARRGFLSNREKTEIKKNNEVLGLTEPKKQPPKNPGLRNISLGGIVFQSAENWTIWLNGVRVTPDKFPKQVTDLKVYKDHIELKWQDEYTDRIYPIRLKPQQIFNLDKRRFVSETGVVVK